MTAERKCKGCGRALGKHQTDYCRVDCRLAAEDAARTAHGPEKVDHTPNLIHCDELKARSCAASYGTRLDIGFQAMEG